MHRILRAFLILSLVGAAACGKDETPGPEIDLIHPNQPDVVSDDASQDTGSSPASDVSVPQDTDMEEDAAEDVTAGDTGEGDTAEGDTGEGDTGEGDTSPFVDPYEGRPLGQCTVNADCPEGPSGKFCNRELPGGSCGACAPDGTGCPADTFCSTYGSCVMECQNNDDCAPGLRCLGNSDTGQCVAMPCDQGVCPVPLFDCSASNFCTRKSCADQADCPEQTSCIAGLCIEDRARR